MTCSAVGMSDSGAICPAKMNDVRCSSVFTVLIRCSQNVAAALRGGYRGPGGEENHRTDDREEHPQHGLDPVLRRGLDLRDEQLPIDPDHAIASASGRSDAKTLSMTSSIGGSSTLMSASWSPSSRTSRAVRSAACERGTWIVAMFSLVETTSPYVERSPMVPRSVTLMRLYGAIRSARFASAPS